MPADAPAKDRAAPDRAAEAPQAPGTVRILPLGGLGEVGMNAMAVDAGSDVIVIDCGVKFPDRPLGADVMHPNFAWLEENRARVRAVVLTHGHEDHVGALPYLLSRMNVPVYGPPYALTIATDRLREHQTPKPDLRPLRVGESVHIGAFKVEPIRVTHSIADATALLLQTPAGQIIHTGDFKIDGASPDGAVFDEARFRRAGDEGVRLLMSDSTNSWVEGETGSEQKVWESLEKNIVDFDQRIVATVFASNVHRLIALGAVAEKTGRSICLLGRSVRKHFDAAIEHKFLKDYRHLLVTPVQAMGLPRGNVLAIATGTQGEARAALSRLARGDHHEFTLDPGDRVLLSARVIPGNDIAVFRMINDLLRRGIDVRMPMEQRGLHVSGHAHRGEQRRMIDLVRPQAFLPVHGTLLQLKRHEELAREMGVKETLVVENGTIVEVGDAPMRRAGNFETGIIYANGPREIDPAILDARSALAEAGFATVSVAVDDQFEAVGFPEVQSYGVVTGPDGGKTLDSAADFVLDEIDALPRRGRNAELVRETARSALRRYLFRHLGIKPITSAVVMEIDA